jgi:hypothetical protein
MGLHKHPKELLLYFGSFQLEHMSKSKELKPEKKEPSVFKINQHVFIVLLSWILNKVLGNSKLL